MPQTMKSVVTEAEEEEEKGERERKIEKYIVY
jgi:hypothetical protein